MICAKKENGQITVFLSIVLLALIALAGVLIDASRIFTADNNISRAARTAVRSALAGYSTKLEDEYGLFALVCNDEAKLKEIVDSYLRRNLMIKETEGSSKPEDFTNRIVKENEAFNDSKYISLLDYRIESISVTPLFNLSENEVVRSQILEYMKFRAPKELIKGIWDKLSAVKESGKMAEAYRKKVRVDKFLGEMDKFQQKLKKNIDGSGSANECYINKFNENGSRDGLSNKYADTAINYGVLKNRLLDIENKINGIESSGKGAKKAAEFSKSVGELEKLEAARTGLQSEIASIAKELDAAWNELYFAQTKAYSQPNAEASQNIRDVFSLGEEARAAIRELEQYIGSNFSESDAMSKDFKKTCNDDIKKLKELLLDVQSSGTMVVAVAENSRLLGDALAKMEEARAAMEASKEYITDRNFIIEQLSAGLEDYNNRIEYDYSRPQRTAAQQDPRKGISEAARQSLKEGKKEDRSIEAAGFKLEELPSHRKVDSMDPGGKEFESSINELDKETNLLNEEAGFSDNALGFLSLMGKALSANLQTLRDEIYINEYVMGTFKNSVPALKDGSTVKSDQDLRYLDKDIRETFFESEVEYILHGNASENRNKILTEAQILISRFGLNTLHVYTDAKKRERADIIATAVAGWWTGGAGIPVISNLIMCGWGMGEAIIDLKDLMDGKAVPFFKSSGDWKLDVGLPGQTGPKADPRFAFTYYDYLRLFLLMEDPEKKINRIEDLIQLNVAKNNRYFEMGSCNTYIRVEATVSIGYLFMTRAFMPEGRKTADGRHKFTAVVYEGY